MIIVSQNRRRHFPYDTTWGIKIQEDAYCEDTDKTYPFGIIDINTSACMAGYETEALALYELDHILQAYELGKKVYRL